MTNSFWIVETSHHICVLDGVNSSHPLCAEENSSHPLCAGENSSHPLYAGENSSHPLYAGENSSHLMLNTAAVAWHGGASYTSPSGWGLTSSPCWRTSYLSPSSGRKTSHLPLELELGPTTQGELTGDVEHRIGILDLNVMTKLSLDQKRGSTDIEHLYSH